MKKKIKRNGSIGARGREEDPLQNEKMQISSDYVHKRK